PIHVRWNGLTIDTLKVSEIPDDHAGLLFEAEGVRLGWSLRSLWEGLNLRAGRLTRSGGSFVIKEFRNPHYLASDFSLDWSLSDIDSTGSTLNGWAKLKQGKGTLKNIDQLAGKSPSAKIALMPVLALMNLERGGILKLGLPDLRYWSLDGIDG